jgi:hypothetical protein
VREQVRFPAPSLDTVHQSIADGNQYVCAINESIFKTACRRLINAGPSAEIIDAIVDPFANWQSADQIGGRRHRRDRDRRLRQLTDNPTELPAHERAIQFSLPAATKTRPNFGTHDPKVGG